MLTGRYINEIGKEAHYNILQIFPEFEGGLQQFYKFLSGNLKYPPNMRRQRIEGRVNVKFIVDKDGSIDDFEILNEISDREELEAEAIRVMRLSPKWNPGFERGKAVRVSYVVPIVFKLRV